MAKKPSNVWAQIGFYASLGFILPASVFVGCGCGWLLDHLLHTSPLLTMVMGFLGAGAGLIELLKILGRAEKDADGSG